MSWRDRGDKKYKEERRVGEERSVGRSGSEEGGTGSTDSIRQKNDLSFEVDEFSKKLINGGDDFRVGLKSTLYCYHFNELSTHVNVGLL